MRGRRHIWRGDPGRWPRRAALLTAVSALAACVNAPPANTPHSIAGPTPHAPSEPAAPMPPGAAARGPIPEDCDRDTARPKRQLRGVWLTTVRNIDWPSSAGLSAREQRDELRARLDRAAELNLNAVFFHARPTADAVYESDKEPWARYLTGEQGGDPGYDPLAFAVTEAHRRGLELHAWFNPYRVGWKDADLAELTEDHPVTRNPEWLVEYGDEGYLDPGNPRVREWVSDVVLDVVERYDIDGVHFDDYFYPYPKEGETFDDTTSWREHGGDFTDRAAWRRDNVNTLLAEIDRRIAETKPWVRFGVSPFGIWRNRASDPDGSETGGLQSYDAQYADSRAWIERGIVDYIAPQLYWPPGFDTADYEELVPWWSRQVAGTGVDLYIGQAAYLVGEDGWPSSRALVRQLDVNAEHAAVSGDIYFSMSSLLENATDAIDEVADTHYRRPALPPRAEEAGDPPPSVTTVEAERLAPEGSTARVRLRWRVPEGARSFGIYRLPDEDSAEDPCALADASHLIAVVGAREGEVQRYTDSVSPEADARYVVTALDSYREESAPSPAVAAE